MDSIQFNDQYGKYIQMEGGGVVQALILHRLIAFFCVEFYLSLNSCFTKLANSEDH